MEPFFETRSLTMRYGTAEVLSSVSLTFPGPEMVSLTGPNGAGKSTLLGIMANLRRGFTGECLYRGKPVSRWRRAAFARSVAFVPQALRLDFPFTAEQVVLMGRTPYAGGLFETAGDWAAVERALRLTGTLEFRHRDFRSLSGGERQRVVLASALAQEPETLLLDEPTTYLDLEHQLSIYRLLRALVEEERMLVIAVTHDLNLAAAFSHRVLALKRGRLMADALPCDALSAARIREIFQVEAEWVTRADGRPWITFTS
jgi:iron complex transport system ATP-binding protein